MRALFIAALAVATFGVFLSSAGPVGLSAQAEAASGGAGATRPLTSEIETSAAMFVLEEFLDGANTLERLKPFYGEYVFYFDQGVRSRAQVMEDKRLYIQRWPDRTLTPDLATVETRPVPGTDGRIDVEVKLEVDFDVEGPGRSASGRSTVSLLLAERSGGFIILSEGGRVISRR